MWYGCHQTTRFAQNLYLSEEKIMQDVVHWLTANPYILVFILGFAAGYIVAKR